MCLIALAYKVHEKYPVLFAANRDEFYKRETQQMHWWEDGILAGRDLEAGGTWFACDKKGRWGAVTNYRNLKLHTNDALSRGRLIPDYLNGTADAATFLENLKPQCEKYNPFNLLLFDQNGLYYFNNIEKQIQELKPGIHTLSNAFLNSDWPKSKKAAIKFESLIQQEKTEPDSVFKMLRDEQLADKSELPDTGVGMEWEQVLSSMFIKSPDYGTRCSTFMRMDNDQNTEVWEQTYVPDTDEALKYFSF
ncbi:MAG: NRDE family protein [Chitinophagales bacterium]